MKPVVAFLSVVCCCVAPLQAELILPVTATASTNHGGTRDIAFAVNGAGLTGDQHTSMPDPNMWLSEANDPNPWYKIDLGGTYNVDAIQVWNYNEMYFDHDGNPGTNRGFNTADIWVSLTGLGTSASNPAEWQLITDDQSFTQAPGTNGYVGEIFGMGGVVARYILFDDVTNFGTNNWEVPENRYGLSEVQVFGTQMAIAEPSSFALLLIGGVGIACYRRRNKRSANQLYNSSSSQRAF